MFTIYIRRDGSQLIRAERCTVKSEMAEDPPVPYDRLYYGIRTMVCW